MSDPDESRDGITFAEQVPATEEDRLSWKVENPATLEGVSARIYRGAENTLRLNLYHIAQGGEVEIVEPIGKDYIDGDDDVYEWQISRSLQVGDRLQVKHHNTDGANAHNYRVNMDIDYNGGLSRLTSMIRGWL